MQKVVYALTSTHSQYSLKMVQKGAYLPLTDCDKRRLAAQKLPHQKLAALLPTLAFRQQIQRLQPLRLQVLQAVATATQH